jgi:hypothetical protein
MLKMTFRHFAFLLALGLPLLAQDSGQTVKRALLEGYILSDQSSQGLRRATITLRPKGSGKPVAAETDDAGKYSIASIEPGQYTMEVRRDGYIPAQWGRRGGIRMPRAITLLAGQEIKDLNFRLQLWGVFDGNIKFDDGEGAGNVPVLAYRKTYLRGRLSYEVAGSARTNDRGAYRISGLSPGAYLVAAIYNKPVRPRDADDDPLDAPEYEMSYSSTFFTSGHELADAVPLYIHAGEELHGVDMYLTPVKTIRVRVEVTDGCTGQLAPQASIELFRLDDSGQGTIPLNADVQGSGGVFVIRGLAPGSYLLMASADPRIRECAGRVRERRLLRVSNYPVDNLTLTMRPPVLSRFSVRGDDPKASNDYSNVQFHLEARSGHSENVALRTERGGSLTALVDPQETYDLVVDRGLTGEYLAGPFQVSGLSYNTIRIGTRGAQLYGAVLNGDRAPVPGATVTLIPDPAQDRAQAYGEAYSDDQGHFYAHGLAPGKYIAVPWLDTAPCDFYDWQSQEACRAVGGAVEVKAGDQKAIELILKLEQ